MVTGLKSFLLALLCKVELCREGELKEEMYMYLLNVPFYAMPPMLYENGQKHFACHIEDRTATFQLRYMVTILHWYNGITRNAGDK